MALVCEKRCHDKTTTSKKTSISSRVSSPDQSCSLRAMFQYYRSPWWCCSGIFREWGCFYFLPYGGTEYHYAPLGPDSLLLDTQVMAEFGASKKRYHFCQLVLRYQRPTILATKPRTLVPQHHVIPSRRSLRFTVTPRPSLSCSANA